jgi:hypothetical protein
MQPISLPILHHSDNTATFKEMGIDYSLDECELRNMVFYHINAISPYFDNEKEYTNIHTNGSEYICPLTIKEVKNIIKNEHN